MTRTQREDNDNTWNRKQTGKEWKVSQRIWWKIYSKKKSEKD